jgi:hypothetical protein
VPEDPLHGRRRHTHREQQGGARVAKIMHTQLRNLCPSALPAPRHTAAIAQLSQALNDTHTNYPGTNLTLRYSIKSHQ